MMKFCKATGIIIYLDLDKNIILGRANKMKIDRIVGSSTMSLEEVLEYRGDVYQKYYDIRIIVSDDEDPEITCNTIIDKLLADEGYISTRGEDCEKHFLDVIKEGLAKDGGLYVPKDIPKLRADQFQRLVNMTYKERF
jgi:ferredoxin-fold anticodon binding domain-containing protein